MSLARRIMTAALVIGLPMGMLYTLWGDPLSAGEDDVIYYYPLRVMAAEQIRAGVWPVDNPREACGSALMGDPQTAVMHPTTLLFVALDAKLAYSLSIFTAFALAGGGMWLYLRRLGLAGAAALFGTVVFAFCGFMVGHRVHLSMILAAAMLPWGMWCIEGLRSRPGGTGFQPVLWMVPVAFLAITAGHWPTLIHMLLVWTAYLLLRARPLGRSIAAAAAGMALAAAVAGPQLLATGNILAQTTRAKIGYAMATENSFFPLSGILSVFPFLFGSRTPNLMSRPWWGPWHLCETLGYVGLVTLVLAAAAVWRLYRKGKSAGGAPVDLADRGSGPGAMTPIVRVWTWLGCGAMVWMLGGYLPTYHLVHMLPVLGVVRCPARMILALDMALATLAAAAVHGLSSGAGALPDRLARLKGTVGRLAWPWLPVGALGALLVTAAAAAVLVALFPGGLGGWRFNVAGPGEALKAMIPTNPAVWVPIAMIALTLLSVRFWLRDVSRRTPVLVILILVDLFVITRFVDVPAGGYSGPDPDDSPAATWLTRNDPDTSAYRIWGLGDPYSNRQAELLLAKTGQVHGLRTISNYGPFQSPRHVHLLGFRIFGTNRDWQRMIRQNHLLTLYNVKYLIVAAGSAEAKVIEDVTMGDGEPADDGQTGGDELLRGPWQVLGAEQRDGIVHLSTGLMQRESAAWREAGAAGAAVYRISLDARATAGGAANSLYAGLCKADPDGSFWQHEDVTIRIDPEQLGENWRHFEWTCQTPPDMPQGVAMRVSTRSERPIDVRNVSLRRGVWPGPIRVTDRPLNAGQRVYRRARPSDLPALREGQPGVTIYENRLYGPLGERESGTEWDDAQIDALKWGRPEAVALARKHGPPSLALRSVIWPDNRLSITLAATSLPAFVAYTLLLACGPLRRRRSGKSPGTPRTSQRSIS